MALQQPLVRRSEEREAAEEVLVVRLHPFGETRARIARGDEADQDRVDVDLMAIRGRAAAEAASVRKLRIDGGVDGDDVAGRAVSDRNRTSEVDGVDDVEARSLQRVDRRGGDTESL